ncbi:hypothetical protein Sango_3064100 [Sesamum angolense]|uniref:Reverse transcriptase domain-containing protein n=1 Tax=Sesamum angolense TaxID=2727404 RepID=A0AAE1TAC8_9LAMI|nr:hypothetical protein Sango_3064100 [Sesamum angolense]
MVLRKLKHTEVPVWIKLRHLPVELWTTEGLSMVASGIGRPLYPDAITRACTRLDFARVCIMLKVSSKLPKHVVIMMPNELGEIHAHHKGRTGLKINEKGQADLVPEVIHPETETDRVGEEMSEYGRISLMISFFLMLLMYYEKPMMTKTARQGVLTNATPQMFPHVEHSNMECEGPEQEGPPSCSPRSCQRIQEFYLDGDGLLIMRDRVIVFGLHGIMSLLMWNFNGSQFVHCRVLIHELHETILNTVVYGANEVTARRELWQGLIELAVTVGNVPWLVGGDFNAVLDMSEVSGASGDIRVAMNEFNDCILQTGLLPMPMQGERFTWHNCSLDGRSLWKRLDRLLVNDVWMDRWPNLFYTCLTPRTSDHSPLVLKGDCRNMQVSLFRFDNYLALSPGFLASVQSIWRHPVIGTPMYSVTRKLKALKSVFRKQRRSKGDLAMNSSWRQVFWRLVYLKASKLEQVMLRQRAKLQWMKGGDQCSKVFFRQVATRRANRRIFQISDDDGNEQTEPTIISSIFVGFFQGARGLRQGDPMSPYLFVLVMEVLHMILQQLIEQDGEFQYHWRCVDLNLFQSSFADDLLLLCKADVRSVLLFGRGLDTFATLSGLHTNPQKSQLIISKAASGLRDSLLETLGSRKVIFRSDTLAYHLFQHGFLLQIVNHYFRRLTAALKVGKGPALLCWTGSTYQICFDFLRGVLGCGNFSYQRFDCGTARFRQLRITKELGVGGKCSHFGILWCLRSTFALEMETPFHYGMIHGTRLDLSFLDSPGTQLTNTGLLDKLSVVIKDGQWNWPRITDIGCLEITYMLPPISEGRTE